MRAPRTCAAEASWPPDPLSDGGSAGPDQGGLLGRPFVKELLRKAALLACEDDVEGEGAIRVTDAHMSAALDQLLDSGSQLTRVLLGGEQPTAPARKGTLGARL